MATAAGLRRLIFTLMVFSLTLSALSDTEEETNSLDIREDDLSMKLDMRQYGPSNGCPLCDSSVYGYCSYKMIHDSCCCDYPAYVRPPQCYYSDCTFLFAKSCYEYMLIKNCCCNSPY